MRKIKAHYIFDGYQFHAYATLVLNDDNSVKEILPHSDVEEAQTEFYSGIICPGFINAHCHLELSHLHNQIPQHCGLPNFIKHVVSLRNSIESTQEYMERADNSMREQGIVAVGDISNTTQSIEIKQHSSIYYHSFIELFDMFSQTQQIFAEGKALFKTFRSASIPCSLSPHAPYSCSRTLFERISEHAQEYETIITIHNQEHNSENEFFASNTGELFSFLTSRNVSLQTKKPSGKTSLQTYAAWLPPLQHIVFVHNTHTVAKDIDFLLSLRSKDTFTFVICPLSNKYIAQELPPIELFMQYGISVAIGTDSLASNTSLSILDEICYLQEKFPKMSLEYLLQCATINGAKALGIHKTYGSFNPGTTPGVILLEGINLRTLQCTEQSRIKVLI